MSSHDDDNYIASILPWPDMCSIPPHDERYSDQVDGITNTTTLSSKGLHVLTIYLYDNECKL